MDAFIHNFDPFAIQFTSTFGIRWYGLAYLAGFLIGFFLCLRMHKKGMTPLSSDHLADITTFVAIGTMVGGRLGYCIFYSPDLFVRFTGSFPFWGVLAVNEGGMASHGGILGIMAVCLWYARRKKITVYHVFDLCTYGGAVGIFFGRIANFINGELWGRVVETPVAWAVKFPSEIYTWLSNKSGEFDKLYSLNEVVKHLGVTESQWRDWLQSFLRSESSHTQVYQTLEKMMAQVQAGNLAVLESLQKVLPARHPSQLYEALLEGLMVFVVLTILSLKPQKPGVVSAAFVVVYAIARIIGEMFRMPDAGIGFQWLGLTRGQWLSVIMLTAGLVHLWFMLSRKVEKVPGWLSSENATYWKKHPFKS